ncbi:MAG TPA: hypothetical protein PL097_06100 [Dysgonamonadaceae bacterium]|nr:hypothetical protein [Dysgonamonadaceae bacterium]
MLNLNEWDSVPKSAISSISSISSVEDIEDFDSEQMPTFSESVTDLLPSLLSQIAAKAVSPEDADLLLPSSLTTFSAGLPNVYGIYGGRADSPLFLQQQHPRHNRQRQSLVSVKKILQLFPIARQVKINRIFER